MVLLNNRFINCRSNMEGSTESPIEIDLERFYTTTVPWYNKDEFAEVYRGLFSGNVFDMKWAVNRITVWEGRCHPSLDVGIDATAGLIRAVLQDKLFENNTSLCDTPDLRLIYATALIRFTNIVAHVTHAPTTPMSIRDAAAKMKIPSWIVDLRNKAAHVRLPCIETLRQGAEFALEYLRTNYWAREIQLLADSVSLQDTSRGQVADIILQYQEYQYECLVNKRPGGGLEKIDATMKTILVAVQKFIKTKRSLFLETLVSPGMFLPSAESLLKILKSSDDETSFIELKTVDLPSSLEKFWMPLIKTLAMENAIQEFAEQLLKTPKENLHQKVAACWMLKFIDNYGKEECSVLKKIKPKYQPRFNFFRLLGCCLDNCCEYSPALLPIICDKLYPPLPEDKRSFIMAAVAIYIGATVDDGNEKAKVAVPDMSNVFTAEQLKEVLKNKQRDEEASIWHQPPDDIDWANIPFGYVFGDQEEFTSNLPPAANEVVEPEEATAKIEPKLDEEKKPQSIQEAEVLTEAERVKPFEYNPNNIALYCMIKQ